VETALSCRLVVYMRASIVLLYNDIIFVFIVFYVDPASGLPYAINVLCVCVGDLFMYIVLLETSPRVVTALTEGG